MMRFLFSGLFIFLTLFSYSQKYAIKADRLINGKSNTAQNNPIIIVENGKIIEINFANHIQDSCTLIDLTGYTLLPGLIDAHTHLLIDVPADYGKETYNFSPSFRSLRAVEHLKRSLDNGFTTIRDLCTEGAGFADVDLSNAVNLGYISGPRIVPVTKGIAATGRYAPGLRNQNWELDLPSGTEFVSGSSECLKAVREQISRGAKWIKVFVDWGKVSFTFEELSTIVEEAKRFNIPVAAHAESAEGIELAIRAGVKSIEHGDGFTDALIKMAIDSNVYWCPTISFNESRKDPAVAAKYKMLSKAYQLGMKIVLSTDVGSGYSWKLNQSRELEFYVKNAGFTPMDAIKCGTYNAANLLGRKDDLGQLEKNFVADIIAVKGNPLDDIILLQSVAFVMKDGKVYKQPEVKK